MTSIKLKEVLHNNEDGSFCCSKGVNLYAANNKETNHLVAQPSVLEASFFGGVPAGMLPIGTKKVFDCSQKSPSNQRSCAFIFEVKPYRKKMSIVENDITTNLSVWVPWHVFSVQVHWNIKTNKDYFEANNINVEAWTVGNQKSYLAGGSVKSDETPLVDFYLPWNTTYTPSKKDPFVLSVWNNLESLRDRIVTPSTVPQVFTVDKKTKLFKNSAAGKVDFGFESDSYTDFFTQYASLDLKTIFDSINNTKEHTSLTEVLETEYNQPMSLDDSFITSHNDKLAKLWMNND